MPGTCDVSFSYIALVFTLLFHRHLPSAFHNQQVAVETVKEFFSVEVAPTKCCAVLLYMFFTCLICSLKVQFVPRKALSVTSQSVLTCAHRSGKLDH